MICRNLLIFVAFEFEGYHGGDDVDYYVDDVFSSSNAECRRCQYDDGDDDDGHYLGVDGVV